MQRSLEGLLLVIILDNNSFYCVINIFIVNFPSSHSKSQCHFSYICSLDCKFDKYFSIINNLWLCEQKLLRNISPYMRSRSEIGSETVQLSGIS